MSLRPSSRRLALLTDMIVEAESVQRRRIPGGTVCMTEACKETYWGHRIETDAPPWEEGWAAWLARWRQAHGDRVEKAVLAWESDEPYDVPDPPRGVSHTLLSALSRSGVPPAVELEVARLGPEHWDALREMAAEVNGMGDDAGNRAYLSWYWGRAREWAEAGRSARYGVFSDGVLVSSCGLVWGDGFARFQDVMTRAPHRRRGYARAALTHAMQSHATLDPDAVYVLVVEMGTPAESLYTSLGFQAQSHSVEFTLNA